MKKYSICIITYCGSNRLYWLLKSIQKNTKTDDNYEIIIVDDGSKEKHKNHLKAYLPQFKNCKLFENETNLGITKSWNRCVKESENEIVILLNDDLILTPNWLEHMTYFIENNKNVGAVGYPTFFINEEDMPKYFSHGFIPLKNPNTRKTASKEEVDRMFSEQNNTPGACAVVVGCAFGFKKSVWQDVGRFDENIRSLYEDYDFCTALLKNGYQNYMLRNPIIYHVLSGTFSQRPELKACDLLKKSEAYYIQKYGGVVQEVADKLFEQNKKQQLIKFLDKDGSKREEYCSL